MRPLLLTGLLYCAGAFAANVTYSKDVAPVIQSNCQGCHRPGEATPMTFMNYAQVRPWAKAIQEAVALKKMPPWYADPHVGKFRNDRSLPQKDVETIKAWVAAGAPEGDPRDLPAPVAYVEGWNIGKPDLEIEMPNAFNVPSSGTIEYQYIVVANHFPEDRWVQMAEVRPGNRALVHHVIASLRAPGSKWLRDAVPGVPFVPKKDAEGGGASEFLVGYAPGAVPEVIAPGRGKLVKAGSDIVFQLHYTANGTAGTDKTKVGLVFAKETPAERVLTVAAMNRKFVIPAGASNYQVDADLEFGSDVKLVSLFPHMHLRGKDFAFRVKYPQREPEALLQVPRYDFNWQLGYQLDQERVLPKGTKIECTAHFDNSPNNPNNPDPKSEVKWGDQSWEEMMIGFMEIAIPRDMDTKSIFPEKKQEKRTTTD